MLQNPEEMRFQTQTAWCVRRILNIDNVIMSLTNSKASFVKALFLDPGARF